MGVKKMESKQGRRMCQAAIVTELLMEAQATAMKGIETTEDNSIQALFVRITKAVTIAQGVNRGEHFAEFNPYLIELIWGVTPCKN